MLNHWLMVTMCSLSEPLPGGDYVQSEPLPGCDYVQPEPMPGGGYVQLTVKPLHVFYYETPFGGDYVHCTTM
jgi:hypothetical protein